MNVWLIKVFECVCVCVCFTNLVAETPSEARPFLSPQPASFPLRIGSPCPHHNSSHPRRHPALSGRSCPPCTTVYCIHSRENSRRLRHFRGHGSARMRAICVKQNHSRVSNSCNVHVFFKWYLTVCKLFIVKNKSCEKRWQLMQLWCGFTISDICDFSLWVIKKLIGV